MEQMSPPKQVSMRKPKYKLGIVKGREPRRSLRSQLQSSAPNLRRLLIQHFAPVCKRGIVSLVETNTATEIPTTAAMAIRSSLRYIYTCHRGSSLCYTGLDTLESVAVIGGQNVRASLVLVVTSVA